MRLLTWNIRSGGGSRDRQILETVGKHAPDVAVLTEFRNNRTGEVLREGLRDLGLTCQTGRHSPGSVNSILIAARTRFGETVFPRLNADFHRCILARLDGLNLFGVYFAQKQGKQPLFEFLAGLSSRYVARRSLLLGDFNTGTELDGGPFFCGEYFEGLEQAGWTDVWRRRYPRKREYSWFSSRGNGFRIDHALVSRRMLPRIRAVRYSHRERIGRISDHSALILELT